MKQVNQLTEFEARELLRDYQQYAIKLQKMANGKNYKLYWAWRFIAELKPLTREEI